MQGFVWEYVDGITSNYHDGGGVLVIAENLVAAREALGKEGGVKPTSEVFTQEPSWCFGVVESEPKVFIFADAGCC